jgi:hypothetical protein
MHKKREACVAAQRSTGTELVPLKHKVVEEAFEETGIRLVSINPPERRLADIAFRLGAEAGNRFRLDRPVNGLDVDLLT